MAWILLVVAGVLEIAWAILMKLGAGPSQPARFAGMLAAMIASFVLLARAMRDLPVGTAYAVWTGIGAAGAALLGIVLLGEPAGLARMACLGLIVAGIVGLKLVSPA
jgi:quaternary ammonium compound-resistance protein SugE